VAEASWPSPNHNARVITDDEYEKLAARFTEDGVYGDPKGTAVVSAGVGLQVVVRAGVEASVRGHYWTSGTADLTLTVAANASGSRRQDWIVLRLDRSTWDVTVALHQGTPGSGLPSVTRQTGSTGVWEVVLGYVQIESGAASVTVVPYTQYVGTRIRPCTSSTRTAAGVGAVIYETDTGRWMGWNGTSWLTLYEDTGELSISPGFSVWTPFGDNIAQKRSGVVELRLAIRRVTGTFVAGDEDGSKIGALPAAVRPGRYEYGAGTFNNGASCRIEVRTDGEIWAKYPSKDVGSGYSMLATITYLA